MDPRSYFHRGLLCKPSATGHGLACQLLDGPLAMKMKTPDTPREAQIETVLDATRSLLRASLSAPAKPPATKAGKRRTPRRT